MGSEEKQDLIFFTRGNPAEEALPLADILDCAEDWGEGVPDDHVAIAYGTDTVTFTLFQGSDPTAGQVACPDIAVLKQTTITLDQPLAGRTIVDGAVD